MTQLPATATPGSAPAVVDWAAESFRVFEDFGERTTGFLGTVKDDHITWSEHSHVEYDGVGGFAHILRERGLEVGPLPSMPKPQKPGFLAKLWVMLRTDPSALRVANVRWKKFDPTRRFAGDRTPPPWRLLTAEETARGVARAEELGVSPNTLLLTTLDAAVAPRLIDGDAPSLWMIPVNMRGAVKASRETANQSSYLPVQIPRGAAPPAVHAEIKARLASGVHWAVWTNFSLGYWLGRTFYKKALRSYYDRAGHPWLGSFTNFGAWPLPGDDDGGIADGFVAGPPPLKTVPVGAGALTWKGRLGLVLHAHPSLLVDQAEVDRWLDAWVEGIRKS